MTVPGMTLGAENKMQDSKYMGPTPMELTFWKEAENKHKKIMNIFLKALKDKRKENKEERQNLGFCST